MSVRHKSVVLRLRRSRRRGPDLGGSGGSLRHDLGSRDLGLLDHPQALILCRRGIGAGGFLSFMASFDNVPVSLFLADERTEVLPIHLWQQIETNLDVRTAAASGVIILFTIVLMVIAERFAGLSSQMR